MDNDTDMDEPDLTRIEEVSEGTYWDPRGDMDDDGDVDETDLDLVITKQASWPPAYTKTIVKQAFGDVDNPFMFQGRPHLAFDTEASAQTAELMLNDHRARLTDVVTALWNTRDPLYHNRVLLSPRHPVPNRRYQPIARSSSPRLDLAYHDGMSPYRYVNNNSVCYHDPSGEVTIFSGWVCIHGDCPAEFLAGITIIPEDGEPFTPSRTGCYRADGVVIPPNGNVLKVEGTGTIRITCVDDGFTFECADHWWLGDCWKCPVGNTICDCGDPKNPKRCKPDPPFDIPGYDCDSLCPGDHFSSLCHEF